MKKDPFEEYLKHTEADKYEKGCAWNTAIGLQAVDGLKTSEYLKNTAIKNIEGEITFNEANELINSYYIENVSHSNDRTEEADKVSLRIAQILSENAFTFSTFEYLSIHKRLFSGIFDFAGEIRKYNISKKEWVLDGKSVIYGNCYDLRETINYDIENEKTFRYSGLSQEQIIKHLAFFVSRLWQIHAFGEGNTRTTAVFFIKYLRQLGYSADNTIFAENAWYFRNALVRANYSDVSDNIYETTEFLEKFLRNLLLNEKNELKNRAMHLRYSIIKQDIEEQKQDIEEQKQDIDLELSQHLSKQIALIKNSFDKSSFFGRMELMEVLQLSASATTNITKKLLEKSIIEKVSGHGKGKYRLR